MSGKHCPRCLLADADINCPGIPVPDLSRVVAAINAIEALLNRKVERLGALWAKRWEAKKQNPDDARAAELERTSTALLHDIKGVWASVGSYLTVARAALAELDAMKGGGREAVLHEAIEAIRQRAVELKRDERPLPLGVHYGNHIQNGLDQAIAAVEALRKATP